MTRFRAALFAVTLAAAPAAAQVGYTPSASPFRDMPWKQSISGFAGGFDTGSDAAGVGPQPGWLAGVRYDLRIGGPVSLVTRIAAAPTSRRVIDPTKPATTRFVGDENSQLMAADLGLAMNLTGQKSFHRLIPVLQGGVGLVTDFRGTPDDGGYRFGTRFMFTWGAGVRYHTEGRWEPRLDFTNYLWQLQYPPAYLATPSDGSAAAVPNGKKSPWMGNHLWSLGLSYQLFR
ncbi:MAG: hypothetical protein P3B98_12810 [Gemmatimonadota bacterium]|nr:hypothetical protein [Gemmatimonadota bacterium]